MKNPYAARWTTFARGEEPLEAKLIQMEAQEAEEAPVFKCGNCGEDAFYRPGVGAYQCGTCRSLMINRLVDGVWQEEWVA